MPTAKITSKGQITIPIEVREKLKLKTGDKVDFFEEDGRYVFQPRTAAVKKGSIKEMRGILKKMGLVPDGSPVSIEAMHQAILDRAAELDDATKSEAYVHGRKTDVA